MRVAIIGDYASQYYLIGKELTKRGYNITYFLQNNKYADLPENFYCLGDVYGNLLFNYVKTGYWMAFGKFFKRFPIQVINGTYKNIVRATNTCYHYHGSDLRLKTVEPKYPSFVSQRELLDYSEESVFIPRCADHSIFRPMVNIKEEKEEFKEEEGCDFIVGHFAPSVKIKGSDLINKAIELLQEETGYSIHFINKPVPKDKIPETMNFCDLVLDHANAKVGQTYNVLSIEALLCEVPVGSYYSTEYIDYPEMKEVVEFLEPKSIKSLKNSILNILKGKLQVKREIVMKYHSPSKAVDEILNYWEEWNFI